MFKPNRYLFFLLFLFWPARSSDFQTAVPEEMGFSSEGLARIKPAMTRYVEEGKTPGIAMLVARRGKIVYWEHTGNAANKRAVNKDTLFRIFSMTKPVTSVAVLILYEEGKIGLDDPVSKYIPEFTTLKVYVEAVDEAKRPKPNRNMTIEDLLTHTSGLTYGFFGQTPVDAIVREARLFEAKSLEDMIDKLVELPLLAHPGQQWNYGVSTDVLGYLIEKVSGQKLDRFFEERILKPLGMNDTSFYVSANNRSRLAMLYQSGENGLTPIEDPDTGPFTKPPALLSGGGGLVSSTGDYLRFAQMLLDKGSFNGARILKPETVAMMTRNRLPDPLLPMRMGPIEIRGYGFGLGVSVVMDIEATRRPGSNGIFRWSGAANTYFWVDPKKEIIGLVMTNYMPFSNPLEREFQTLVYNALKPSG